MAKVSNLRQFRKRKARQDADREAAENRVRHGRTPAQRQHDDEQKAREKRRLDLLRRESPPSDQNS